jgi:hypothetical protein
MELLSIPLSMLPKSCKNKMEIFKLFKTFNLWTRMESENKNNQKSINTKKTSKKYKWSQSNIPNNPSLTQNYLPNTPKYPPPPTPDNLNEKVNK